MPNIEPAAWVNCRIERCWRASASLSRRTTSSTSMGSGLEDIRIASPTGGAANPLGALGRDDRAVEPRRVHALARPRVRVLPGAVAVVGGRPRGLLGVDLGALRRRRIVR